MKNLFCPISDERINEQVPRMTAVLVIVSVIIGFAFSSVLVMAVVAADFFIRAFTKMKFSPLSCLAYWLVRSLKLPAKSIDKAPKIFAARMGFVMTLAFTFLYGMQLFTASAVVAGVLVFFAGLEFAFAFCAGCTIYTYLVLPFYRN
ncbi:MAG: DUF4395 domain-containing protein [Mangrovibacterium sp.]